LIDPEHAHAGLDQMHFKDLLTAQLLQFEVSGGALGVTNGGRPARACPLPNCTDLDKYFRLELPFPIVLF